MLNNIPTYCTYTRTPRVHPLQFMLLLAATHRYIKKAAVIAIVVIT